MLPGFLIAISVAGHQRAVVAMTPVAVPAVPLVMVVVVAISRCSTTAPSLRGPLVTAAPTCAPKGQSHHKPMMGRESKLYVGRPPALNRFARMLQTAVIMPGISSRATARS